MKFLIKAIALVALSVASYNVSAQTLPDVKVENAQGKEIRVRSLLTGKPLIISYWSIACKPCIQELNAINDAIEEWREEADFEVIAVSVDGIFRQTDKSMFSRQSVLFSGGRVKSGDLYLSQAVPGGGRAAGIFSYFNGKFSVYGGIRHTLTVAFLPY